MPDYSSFSHGGSSYPLTSSTTNSALQDADPSVFFAIDFFQSVITTYIGSRLLAEVGRAPVIQNITSAVQQVVPYDPQPYLTQNQFRFPLLAVYRQKSKYDWRAQSWMRDSALWVVEYMLPPLTPGQVERLRPFLHSVEIVLLNRIENMFDPSYQAGLKVWQAAGLEEIRLEESTQGAYSDGGSLVFPSIKMFLTVKERDMPPAAGTFQALIGVDNEIDLASPNDPQLSDVADTQITFTTLTAPTTVPNLVAWYSSFTGPVTAVDGYHVASWVDQSVTALTATAPATNLPILVPRTFVVGLAQTPKAALRFDGLTSYQLSPAVAALAVDTGFTLIVFSRLDNTANRQCPAARTLASDTGAHSFGPEANTIGTVGNRFGVQAGGSSYDTPIGTDQQWHMHVLRATSTVNGTGIASTLTYRLDSTPQSLALRSGSGNWQGMASSTLIAIGANPAALASTAFSGDVASVLAYSRALTDGECLTIEIATRAFFGFPNP